MIRIDPKKKVITVTSGTLEWRSLKDLEPLGIVLTKGKTGNPVLDAEGWTLDARKHSGNKLALDSEARPPALRIRIPGLSVVDMHFRGSPNGITVLAHDVSFFQCVFSEIGEDALQASRVRRLQVHQCTFGPAEDKTIQLNDCEGTAISQCSFAPSRNAIRVSGGKLDVLDLSFFTRTDTAVHVTRGGTSVRGRWNKFQGVRQKYKTEDGGKFIESPTP